MKRSSFVALIALLAISLNSQVFGFAQQKARPQRQVGSTSTGKTSASATTPTRRASRTASSPIPVIERDFDEALKIIEGNYVDGSKLDYNGVVKSSIIGMLRTLDPHSNYYDRDEYEELRNEQRSEYFGIGASIQNYLISDDADTFITATFEESPAAMAGLRFGDRIVAVNGEKMTGKSSLEVRDKIRGPRGTMVNITVERAFDKKMATVSITRDAVPQPSIPDAYFIKPGVGYVDMTRGFNYSTSEELENALHVLRAQGANAIVLDLRNNPGGFLDQAIRVAEIFLPYGQLILTQKGRNGLRDNVFRSTNRVADPIPLVILINGSTASASEIVAGAMQDHDRALIVGATSFGKGLVQSIIPLDYGAGLTLTSAKYYTPSGRLIQRDYSGGGLYDYYKHEESKVAGKRGAGKKTDTGRAVYEGGGIAPDEAVDAKDLTLSQRRLISPLFGFARELVNGRVPGMQSYTVRGPINFRRELQPADFPIRDGVFSAFKSYVANNPTFKELAPLVDANRSFVELQLRFNIVTAAYGRTMADRVFITTDDPQVSKAVDLVPRAKDLAMTSSKHQVQP